jgi:ABC-type multidrug transport system fused ATPase/permease subunit
MNMNKSVKLNPTWSLFVDMLRVLLTYPQWLAAAIISTIVVAALEPSLAWMGKKVVDDFKQGNIEINSSLVNYIVVFGGLLLGLGLIKLGDKIIDKIFETRLIICLQRTYLQRREKERDAEDISHILYHCNRAKPGLDIIHKDSWKIISQTISVIIWQLTLAPAWLPALLIAVIPPILIGFIFGQFIQKASLKMLTDQENIAASTTEAKRLELIEHQESFFRHTIRLEMFKSGTEILMDLLTWFGLLVLVLLSSVFHIGVVPKEIQAGDLVLFWGNLNLLSKPLGDIVKVYNKARESYPALLRVLRPTIAANHQIQQEV